MKKRALASLIFILTTLGLMVTVFYSSYYYYEVFRATHFLDVRVNEFDITLLNSTYARTRTRLELINPSQLSFDVMYIIQRLTYDDFGQSGEYITGKTEWFDAPRQLRPSSNLNLTIDETVPAEKIQVSKTIFAQITIRFRGPLIGEFSLGADEELNVLTNGGSQ